MKTYYIKKSIGKATVFLLLAYVLIASIVIYKTPSYSYYYISMLGLVILIPWSFIYFIKRNDRYYFTSKKIVCYLFYKKKKISYDLSNISYFSFGIQARMILKSGKVISIPWITSRDLKKMLLSVGVDEDKLKNSRR